MVVLVLVVVVEEVVVEEVVMLSWRLNGGKERKTYNLDPSPRPARSCLDQRRARLRYHGMEEELKSTLICHCSLFWAWSGKLMNQVIIKSMAEWTDERATGVMKE